MYTYYIMVDNNSVTTKEWCEQLVNQVPNLNCHPMDYVLQNLTSQLEKGIVVELGVFTGKSITKIAKALPNRTIYGFDSFEGLPEAWNRADGGFAKGEFALKTDKLPKVPSNVHLIKGWFNNTLPPFAQKLHDSGECIALLHIDCDLYSSTVTILDTLAPYLSDKCLVVFDELFNYPSYENHELRALQEFLRANPRVSIEWIGKNGPIIVDPVKDNGYYDQPAALWFTRI
jgi:hypothetical protein